MSMGPSFRWKLLSGFLGFYILIGIGGASSIILNYQRSLEQLRTSHEKWLQTYAETFLSDIEIGNFISVQKKIDILVQRDIVARATLRFGRHELTSQKYLGQRSDSVPAYDKIIARLFQSGRLSIDVSDVSRSVWGNLDVDLDLSLLYKPITAALKKFVIFGGAFFLFCLSLILFYIDTLTATVQSLIGYIQLFSHANYGSTDIRAILRVPPELHVLEMNMIAKEFESSVRNVLRLESEVERHRVGAAIGEVSRQVAHDIRSPLAALEIVAGDVSQLPEDKRILIRAAVGRIRDIANSLLNNQCVQANGSVPSMLEAASPQLLSSLMDPVVSEKRLQYRAQSRVEIELRLDASSYGLFAALQPGEFKRLLSNLINNSVESFSGGAGLVKVSLAPRGGHALVSVQDNGKGIPPELLAKIGHRGETHGKTDGSGLGLYHARTRAESWGGQLEITSEVGKGTTATVILPLAVAPEWFVPELRLSPGKAVVILDDDASIHQVWHGRFDALKVGERDVEVVHVSSPDEMRAWLKGNAAKAGQALYLFDYELLGFRETGLSLAEEFGLGERVILVTSRYEEPEVLAACRRLRVRLIPKGLAGSVPIRIESTLESWDAVLIDDDALTRMTWKMAADRAGKKLRVFSTAVGFMKVSDTIDRATPVYIDAELADGVKGDAESIRIKELGFGEIYLATGHPAEKFAGLAHLRGVIGKEPPWGREG